MADWLFSELQELNQHFEGTLISLGEKVTIKLINSSLY